jgi:hypothetical protein
MKVQNLLNSTRLLFVGITVISVFSHCQKNISDKNSALGELSSANATNEASSANAATPPFNLEVILRGEDNSFGLVKFRQNVDTDRIVDLDVWVRDLLPNHSYLLQRAVDPIATGNCLSTAWLTLGKGLTPQAITTDDSGTGRADLWRSVAAVARGTAFYIHFQVIDAESSAVVLTSDCYQYVVR